MIQGTWVSMADYHADPVAFTRWLQDQFNARTVLKHYSARLRFVPGSTPEPTEQTLVSPDGRAYWCMVWYDPPGYWDFMQEAPQQRPAADPPRGDARPSAAATPVRKKKATSQASFFDEV